MGLYPDEQELSIYGETVVYPGLKDGKFTNGNFADPAVKPSFIPAETVNLVLDNISAFIELCGNNPDNTNVDQLAKLFTSLATAQKTVIRDENGNAQFSDPIVADYAATKAYTDSVQTNLTAHENTTKPHGATATPTADRLAMFDGNTFLHSTKPPDKDATSKTATTTWVRDFVFPIGCFCTQYPGEATPATKYGGTWTIQTQFNDRFARGSGNSAEGWRNAGLPNITGSLDDVLAGAGACSGAFYMDAIRYGVLDHGGAYSVFKYNFSANRSSGIYGASGTVQPADYPLVIWKRTA